MTGIGGDHGKIQAQELFHKQEFSNRVYIEVLRIDGNWLCGFWDNFIRIFQPYAYYVFREFEAGGKKHS